MQRAAQNARSALNPSSVHRSRHKTASRCQGTEAEEEAEDEETDDEAEEEEEEERAAATAAAAAEEGQDSDDEGQDLEKEGTGLRLAALRPHLMVRGYRVAGRRRWR